MNYSKQRKSGVILSYVSIIVTTIIQLLYTPLLIRMLGQSEYGLYSLISSIIGYLTVLDLGFGNAIIVYSTKYRVQEKYEEEKKLLGMFKIIFIIIGVVASILGIVLFLCVPKMFNDTMSQTEINKAKIMMLILAFNLFVSFSFTLYSSIISSYEKFVFQKIMAILNTILKPLIMIPLLFVGFKSIALTVVITIINIFMCLSNYLYCKRKLKVIVKFVGFDKSLFKTIFGYSIWLFLGSIVDKINWSVDQFVLGALSGTIAVSTYAVAGHINTLFLNLSTAISSILLPKISKMVAHKATNEEITEEFIKVGRLQYLIIFLMASGITLFGKEFFITWAGKEYELSYYIALILIIPLCIPLIQSLGISIRQAQNKHKFSACVNIIIAILNLIISIFLTQKYGALGAALGTSIGIIFSSIINNVYYFYVIKIDIIKFWRNVFKMTIPFVIPITAILIIMKKIKLYGFMNLVVFGSIYTIMYVLVCYFMVMNKYEKDIINNIFNKFRRKKYDYNK